jgi:hypothetical protein
MQRIAQQLTEQGMVGGARTEDQWFFLVDPAWPAADQEAETAESDEDFVERGVPLAAIVGGWLVGADGSLSRFNPNPDYEPSTPDSPTDPVDAALQLASRGEMDTDTMFSIMRESGFAIALDEDDAPIVAPAPDGVECLLVTTAPLHRTEVRAEKWQEVDADGLRDLLAESEVDLLLNPGAASSTRLIGTVVTEKLAEAAMP